MFDKIRRALVVEDNKRMRALIRQVLRQFGCADIIKIEDGSLAFGGANIVSLEDGALRDGCTDIVFLNWTIPILDGTACTKHIRSGTLDGFDADVPIIMQTDETTGAETERHAHSIGATNFLRKPFSLRTVVVAVETALKATKRTVAA